MRAGGSFKLGRLAWGRTMWGRKVAKTVIREREESSTGQGRKLSFPRTRESSVVLPGFPHAREWRDLLFLLDLQNLYLHFFSVRSTNAANMLFTYFFVDSIVVWGAPSISRSVIGPRKRP